MTGAAHLDSVRSQMLADMGIEVWLLRDSADPQPPGPAAEPVAAPMASRGESASADAVPEPADPLPSRSASPSRDATATGSAPLAVTCLVNRAAVMFIDNAEAGVSGRLCRDLLSAVTGDWQSAPREVSFSWPAGTARNESWRAFGAFADKQMAEVSARYVLCSKSLVSRLPDLSSDCRLQPLPELVGLGVDDKRALWRSIQNLKR